MDEKQKILEAITPIAVLKAMTPEAKKAVPQALLVEGCGWYQKISVQDRSRVTDQEDQRKIGKNREGQARRQSAE